jgi:hypothetical protein
VIPVPVAQPHGRDGLTVMAGRLVADFATVVILLAS